MIIMMPDIKLKPVGYVINEIKEAQKSGYPWEKVVSEIVIDENLSEALDGLERFSHIIVLYWIHKTFEKGELPISVHPRGDKKLPLVGLFATRSPNRPNSIGKTTARLLSIEGNVLRVKGLDSLDGTPVLDIKPYIPGYDSVRGARVPEWTK